MHGTHKERSFQHGDCVTMSEALCQLLRIRLGQLHRFRLEPSQACLIKIGEPWQVARCRLAAYPGTRKACSVMYKTQCKRRHVSKKIRAVEELSSMATGAMASRKVLCRRRLAML